MSDFGFLTSLKHICTSVTKFVEVRYNLSHKYFFILLCFSLCYLRNMSAFHMQLQPLLFFFFSVKAESVVIVPVLCKELHIRTQPYSTTCTSTVWVVSRISPYIVNINHYSV